MVYRINCNCINETDIIIDTWELFQKYKCFFEKQVEEGIFIEDLSKKPFYTWKEGKRIKKWYATKWYRCNKCGCLWEFNYPDFPAKGFIRKFPDGNYQERGF